MPEFVKPDVPCLFDPLVRCNESCPNHQIMVGERNWLKSITSSGNITEDQFYEMLKDLKDNYPEIYAEATREITLAEPEMIIQCELNPTIKH